MQPAIRVENLSKRYRLGAARADNNLTENLKAGVGRLWRGLTGRARAAATDASEFWALKDVSFEVKPGEVVGIIGRNGAGKSTLLKVLSRIVEPTGGRAVVRGRMGSLLEVGTGFHPELSGRENIYLNGSILGMTQKEIARKFDEIVAFSEIEKFLDTPVKRYSSGMYVRLAFAVAAHLEPEILVVDEVLAVGDVQFQKKCLGKMKEVGQAGRTVLLVSHSMSSIATLCDTGVVLDRGRITESGPISRCIAQYLNSEGGGDDRFWSGDEGDGNLRLKAFWVRQPGSDEAGFVTDKPIEVGVRYTLSEARDDLVLGIDVGSERNGLLAFSRIDDAREYDRHMEPGTHEVRLTIPANTLSQGEFMVRLDMGYHNIRRVIDRTLRFRAENLTGIGRKYYIDGSREGTMRPCWDWRHEARTPAPERAGT